MKFHPVVNYFLKGLLLVVPLGLTIYIISAMVVWIDGLIPIKIPGIGMLTVLLVTTGIGYAANNIIGKPVIDTLNKLILKIPLAGFIYSSINDLVVAFVGDKKKFDQPVLVPFDESGAIMKPGFITQTDLEEIGLPGMVAVYLPHSYNFSGNILLVKRSSLVVLKSNSTDVMKYVVSGGVSGKIEVD